MTNFLILCRFLLDLAQPKGEHSACKANNRDDYPMLVSLPVSIGEAIDKLTILQIKAERISNADKLVNINKELSILKADLDEIDGLWEPISELMSQLKSVNEALWEIEDDIRVKEFKKEFDDEFIRLARAVYVTNDQRADVKKQINLVLGSELVEEKSYEDYQ